jgi:outer membrane lipoprotein SlyB
MLRFLSYVAVLAIGILIGGIGGGLIGEVGGTAIGGAAAACRTIDTAVQQGYIKQEQANSLLKSLVTQLKINPDDAKKGLAALNKAGPSSPCGIATQAL